MSAPEVEAFLSHLATDRQVSASTQTQALSALLFLYREVIGVELPWLDNLVRAKKPERVPVVLTIAEVTAVLRRLEGRNAQMANVLYGSGLRLTEALRLRVKDVDFEIRQITVHDGKGFKDRVAMLPESQIEPLQRYLEKVREIHQSDLREGYGEVFLPYALARKYPNAGREWGWL